MHDIPYIDIRESGPVELARKHLDGARSLIESSRDSFGIISRIVSGFILPASDNYPQC